MIVRRPTNVAQSVRHRLLDLAKHTGRPYNEIEQYYAIERFLYRLGRAPCAEYMVLKGALMLRAWGGPFGRATRDIDLLGQMPRSIDGVVDTVRVCLTASVPDDGVRFDPAAVRGEDIRKDARYQGVRVFVDGTLGTSRLRLQVDVGFGDVIVPGPMRVVYPQLLDFGTPDLLGYTPESMIAEKFEAMVDLDLANSRMKDFYDVAQLAAHRAFDGALLAEVSPPI